LDLLGFVAPNLTYVVVMPAQASIQRNEVYNT